MAADAVSVKFEGVRDLRSALKKLDDEGRFLNELKDVNYEVGQFVVDRARAYAFSPLEAKAAESLKAGRQAARAVVSGGGARHPFFGGAEFGSDKYRQFQPWRGSGENAGYFLYPTIRASQARIVDMYDDGVVKIAREAFPD